MSDQSGKVFNIQRFSTSDGPGIRTVVFLKGCPLNCAWCHNPESKSSMGEVFFKEALCIGCGTCAEVCPVQSHIFIDNIHHFHRESCTACGKCAECCPSCALEMCGEMQPIEKVISSVLRDTPFYQASGGGITLSGGEPLMQYDFSMALLKTAKGHSLHTAVESCGYSLRRLDEIARYVDLWLYDIKLLPEEEHIRYTGVSNRIILQNLYHLSEIGARIILRCPIIPGVNMTSAHFDALAELSCQVSAEAIHIEPYHPLGISKAAQLGKHQSYSNEAFLKKDALQSFVEQLRKSSRSEVVVL